MPLVMVNLHLQFYSQKEGKHNDKEMCMVDLQAEYVTGSLSIKLKRFNKVIFLVFNLPIFLMFF